MRLFVVALSGDRLEVEVEPTATVLDVKQSISARSGLPVAHGQLFLNIEQHIAARQTQTVGEVRAQLEDVNAIVQRFKGCPAADKVDEVAAASVQKQRHMKVGDVSSALN